MNLMQGLQDERVEKKKKKKHKHTQKKEENSFANISIMFCFLLLK